MYRKEFIWNFPLAVMFFNNNKQWKITQTNSDLVSQNIHSYDYALKT